MNILLQAGRFLATGLMGISVNLGSFEIFLKLGVPYLIASTVALCISTVFGFVLQKYWTFKSHATTNSKKQFIQYVVVAILNLGINAAVVFVCVEYFSLHPVLSQGIGGAVVAASSFFIYKFFIFADKKVETPQV